VSMEQNKERVLSLIEALNARDLVLWSRHLSEDYAAELAVLLDKKRSIGYHQRFVTAFPDLWSGGPFVARDDLMVRRIRRK
jgi:hypothetical protein